ncbi:ribonuclease domain-containing protein [Rothia dentocariosa]|uniref:ribonuclease domain-containing protein n=1 Tax=Rothia dentocariosa TaxID=2047 RepID=UPI003B981684
MAKLRTTKLFISVVKQESYRGCYTVTDGKGNPITYTEMDFMAPQPKIGENGEIELKPNGKPETTRGDDRLIVGSNGSIYYSPDHYHTFILLVE